MQRLTKRAFAAIIRQNQQHQHSLLSVSSSQNRSFFGLFEKATPVTPTPNTPGRYVFVFGKNDKGQLGLSTKLKPSRPSSLPIEAFGLGAQVKVISSGTNHTSACTESGELYATGSNKGGYRSWCNSLVHMTDGFVERVMMINKRG